MAQKSETKDLNRWLNKNTTVHLHDNDTYLQLLQDFWNEDFEFLSQSCGEVIEENSSQPHLQLATYRIWIETLAIQKDAASLRILAEHLALICGDKSHHKSYVGLRALIHLELDEFEAAHLLVTGLNEKKHGCYEWEAMARLRLRTDSTPTIDASPCTHGPNDYFHFCTVSKLLVQQNALETIDELVLHCDQLFPTSPFKHTVRYHQHMESGQFEKAADSAGALTRRFPHHSEYLFWLGIALYADRDYIGSQHVLSRAQRYAEVSDPRIATLLGSACARAGMKDMAEHLFINNILDGKSDYRSVELDCMERARLHATTDTKRSTGQPEAFLLRLEPRDAIDLMDADEWEMGRRSFAIQNASAGDYCFLSFAPRHLVDRTSGEGQWKVIAVCRVADTFLDELTGSQRAILELEVKPEVAIPVNVQIDGEGSHRVFRLDENAIDVLTDSVQEINATGEVSEHDVVVRGA